MECFGGNIGTERSIIQWTIAFQDTRVRGWSWKREFWSHGRQWFRKEPTKNPGFNQVISYVCNRWNWMIAYTCDVTDNYISLKLNDDIVMTSRKVLKSTWPLHSVTNLRQFSVFRKREFIEGLQGIRLSCRGVLHYVTYNYRD